MFLVRTVQKWDRIVKSKKQLKCENNLNEISSLLRRQDYPPQVDIYNPQQTASVTLGDFQLEIATLAATLLTTIIEKYLADTEQRYYIRPFPTPAARSPTDNAGDTICNKWKVGALNNPL